MKNLHIFHQLPKQIERNQVGLCFFCHKHVKNIKAHMGNKHRTAKKL